MKHFAFIWSSVALCGLSASAAPPAKQPFGFVTEAAVAAVVPGKSTKTQVEAQLGKPLRIAQFTDCGHSTAPAGQTDEAWDYRGHDANGGYHLHIEFGDDGVLTVLAKIPDELVDGKGIAAQAVPVADHHHLMAGMKM